MLESKRPHGQSKRPVFPNLLHTLQHDRARKLRQILTLARVKHEMSAAAPLRWEQLDTSHRSVIEHKRNVATDYLWHKKENSQMSDAPEDPNWPRLKRAKCHGAWLVLCAISPGVSLRGCAR